MSRRTHGSGNSHLDGRTVGKATLETQKSAADLVLHGWAALMVVDRSSRGSMSATNRSGTTTAGEEAVAAGGGGGWLSSHGVVSAATVGERHPGRLEVVQGL